MAGGRAVETVVATVADEAVAAMAAEERAARAARAATVGRRGEDGRAMAVVEAGVGVEVEAKVVAAAMGKVPSPTQAFAALQPNPRCSSSRQKSRHRRSLDGCPRRR